MPIRGVISDGQQTIQQAVERSLPDVPHQLCHFHYLDEAAGPIFEADRHAKTALKKLMRGVRPIERALEGREDEKSDAMRSYCLAVRSALTDDGHPPLCASGLKLYDRLTQISDSLARVERKKGACLQSCTTSNTCSPVPCSKRRRCGPRSSSRTRSSIKRPTCWPIMTARVGRRCANAMNRCWSPSGNSTPAEDR